MKGTIKKTVSCVVSIVIIFSMGACAKKESKPGPETVVTDFSEAAKQFDLKKMEACVISLDEGELNDIEELKEEYAGLYDFFKQSASEMTYSITDNSVEGESGTITVSYEYNDMSGILGEVMKEYYAQALSLMFSGSKADDEAAEKLFMDLFTDKADTVEMDRKTTSISFDCITYGGEWKIKTVPDEMADVLSSNAVSALTNLSEAWDASTDAAASTPSASTDSSKNTGSSKEASSSSGVGITTESAANEPVDGIYYKNPPLDMATINENIDIEVEYAEDTMAVILTNNNDFVIPDLDVQVLFYKDDVLIGSDQDGHDVVLPGRSVASKIDITEGADKYNVQVSCGWKYAVNYRNWAEDVDVQSNIGNKNVMIQFTNNSGVDIRELEYVVLFYKNGEFVKIDWPQDVYDFGAGSTVVEEVSPYLPGGFDDYKIFINQAHTF